MRDLFGNFTDNQPQPSDLFALDFPYQKPVPTIKNSEVQQLRTFRSGLSVMEKRDEKHFQGLFS